MLINNLIEFGLSEKEAKIYVALVELELATANEIARKAELNRSSTYVVLEALKKRGLVTISGGGNVLHYVATSPDLLLQMAKDNTERQDQALKKIEEIVPELKALHKDTARKPIVKVFEGKDGLVQVVDTVLDHKEKILRIVASLSNFEMLVPYIPKFYQKAKQRHLITHGIHPDDPLSRMIAKNDPSGLHKQFLIPKSKFNFPANFAVYDDKVVYMSPKKGGYAVIIENQDMADVMKSVFDMAWEEAKRIKKEATKSRKK